MARIEDTSVFPIALQTGLGDALISVSVRVLIREVIPKQVKGACNLTAAYG